MTRPEDDPRLMDVDELFTYHIFGIPDECRAYVDDPSGYTLTVGGLVDNDLRLTLADLKNNFPAVSGDMVLQCMTNVHWGRVRFTGVRLLDVIERARPEEGAVKAALRGADGFDTFLHIDEIRAEPDAFLLAYAMNDVPMTLDHGCPVRLAADGRYGYKWPKWLVEIELTDASYKGHYEGKRGWADRGMRGQPVT